VSQPSHGPALPDLLPTPLDPNQRRNYTQTFDYDTAGNLITRHHSGAPGFSMFTSAHSNRSLGQLDDGSLPGEPQITVGFDMAGNPLALRRGLAMDWDVRNQLVRVTLVKREGEADDYEWYVYDRPGHRLRKTYFSQASGQTLISEVRYLPGIEIHRETNAKERHVISVDAGRNQVRMLHWPDGAERDQLRYCLGDHLGSSTLELDDSAGLLSQEHYYPFGGTACWAGKSALVAKHKTIRYSGKELDATGLYFYGYRYYAPWLQRWAGPDPLGNVDGLNQYQMVGNRPLNFYDWQGTIKIPVDILISDVVNPMAKGIGTGWFEELIWNQEKSAFQSTGSVYGRGMEVYQGESSQWSLSSSGQAITMFRDQDNKLRLFANMYFQHMGMQPGMGLPVFAGVLRSDETDPTRLIISNHSGHYKPESSIDIEPMIREIAPQQQSISYAAVPESSFFDSTIRLDAVDSPEAYSDLVNSFKNNVQGLIGYLKEQGIWDVAKQRWGHDEAMNIIFKMEATGLTAQQVRTQEFNAQYAKPAEKPAPAKSLEGEVRRAPPSVRNHKPSFFRSLFAWN
ncbi:RHS repeat domain-containing protein, partial [Pseudomonas sp. NPDC087614]|uniref:RHS repeat domain-containing protein n=1 Tax=Pseudomonas sp. NPDC087614 TaxID=3364442 RepID=UPI00381F4F9E